MCMNLANFRVFQSFWAPPSGCERPTVSVRVFFSSCSADASLQDFFSPSRHQNSGARYSSWNLDEIQWMNGHSDHRMKLKFETVWSNMIQFHLNVLYSLKTEFHVISHFLTQIFRRFVFLQPKWCAKHRKTPVQINWCIKHAFAAQCRTNMWFAHQQKQRVRHGETTLE